MQDEHDVLNTLLPLIVDGGSYGCGLTKFRVWKDMPLSNMPKSEEPGRVELSSNPFKFKPEDSDLLNCEPPHLKEVFLATTGTLSCNIIHMIIPS